MRPHLFRSKLSILFGVFLSCMFMATGVQAKDLNASMAYLPELAETPDKGVFVDLIKAMDGEYKDGIINIAVYPFNRSIDNVVQGEADFHIPMGKSPFIPEEDLPFGYASEKLGDVVFVLYTRSDDSLTIEDIDKAKKQGDFPYAMETYKGTENFFDFPVKGSEAIDQSFQKLLKKRVDGCLFAQEEADSVLKELNLKGIKRTYFTTFDDVLVIQKGPAGNETDRILSAAIQSLKSDGRLQALHLKIHEPYQDWQP